MSGRLARLDACSPKEKDDALAFLSGYSPDAFDRCMLHVERFRKPPRIPEPGQFGVVEAATVRSPGRHKWVRQGELWWNGSTWNTWNSLTDPILIREGLS